MNGLRSGCTEVLQEKSASGESYSGASQDGSVFHNSTRCVTMWAVTKSKTYDVVVAGAGVFGAWTALHLARRGQRVLLVDAYGPANARASSGGESRIIRMGYGADELYTRWAIRSLVQWKELFSHGGAEAAVATRCFTKPACCGSRGRMMRNARQRRRR